ncbi:MAG: molybdate ABC transporter permease subunit, partial [Spirochaeta sp.]
SGWAGVPVRTLEAAAVMGRSRLSILLHIALPQIKTAVISGAIVSFAHTLGSFGLVLMVGGSIPGVTRVISIAIYEEFEAGRMAAAHLYAGILLAVSCVVVWSLHALQRKGA